MKATVAVEFDPNELGNLAIKVVTRTMLRLLGTQDPAVQSAMSGLQQWLMGLAVTGTRPHSHTGQRPGPPGYPYGGPMPGPVPQGNVRPIRETGAVEHCFSLPESRYMEAAWACCGCTTVNVTTRAVCRTCAHPCCVPAAPPPPPAPEPAPL